MFKDAAKALTWNGSRRRDVKTPKKSKREQVAPYQISTHGYFCLYCIEDVKQCLHRSPVGSDLEMVGLSPGLTGLKSKSYGKTVMHDSVKLENSLANLRFKLCVGNQRLR